MTAAEAAQPDLVPVTVDPESDWFFTFGAEHKLLGIPLGRRYVRIHGTFMGARLRMIELFDQKWCSQYESEEDAGVEQYGLTELHVPRQPAGVTR